VLRVVVLSGAGQKAFLLSMGFLLVFAGWMWRAWIRGPETLPEKDEAKASADRERMRDSGRVRTVNQKPEWLRRWERKVLGVKRLGDSKLERSER
jgi:hypothetical protein